MRKLKVLKLCIDNIHSIPKTIAKLRELEEIYFGYKGVRYDMKDHKQQYTHKLEFDLRYARFSRFPEEICEMRKLKVLRLCINNIHSIPNLLPT